FEAVDDGAGEQLDTTAVQAHGAALKHHLGAEGTGAVRVPSRHRPDRIDPRETNGRGADGPAVLDEYARGQAVDRSEQRHRDRSIVVDLRHVTLESQIERPARGPDAVAGPVPVRPGAARLADGPALPVDSTGC